MQHLEQASVKLFITSRLHSHSIRQQLGSSPQVAIEASTSDITKYITETIDKDDAANDVIDETLMSEVILELCRGSQGMFLLPVLQIQNIVNQTTKSEVR